MLARFSSSASGTEGVRWTQETGIVGLGDLPGGGFLRQASTVSADGSVLEGTSEIAVKRIPPLAKFAIRHSRTRLTMLKDVWGLFPARRRR